MANWLILAKIIIVFFRKMIWEKKITILLLVLLGLTVVKTQDNYQVGWNDDGREAETGKREGEHYQSGKRQKRKKDTILVGLGVDERKEGEHDCQEKNEEKRGEMVDKMAGEDQDGHEEEVEGEWEEEDAGVERKEVIFSDSYSNTVSMGYECSTDNDCAAGTYCCFESCGPKENCKTIIVFAQFPF